MNQKTKKPTSNQFSHGTFDKFLLSEESTTLSLEDFVFLIAHLNPEKDPKEILNEAQNAYDSYLKKLVKRAEIKKRKGR